MPNAPAHPEAQAEDDHLRATLDILEGRIEEVGKIPVYGANPHDTASLHHHFVLKYQILQLARQNVYFGRLDLRPEGAAAPETHYIGRIGFDQRGQIVVVDWRAPLARLFSRRRPGPIGYDSPDGRRQVDLQLKRHVVLDQQSLSAIFDDYDARPDSPSAGLIGDGLADPDAYLRQILSGRRDAYMQDIIATIQEHQDELIRAEMLQVLLIQGAAGSGKTSVALHRLAYLLYPPNKLALDVNRCIIFGPNQLFLGYISGVLPGLGVDAIAQTTLDTWALERLGLVDSPLTDSTLAALLDGRQSTAEKQRLVRRSQLKGSLRFGQVLERFAEAWRGRLSVPAQGLAYKSLGPLKLTVRLPRMRVAEAQLALRELPVSRHRQRLGEVLLEELMGSYTSALEREADEQTEQGESMRERRPRLLAEAARLDEYAEEAQRAADLDLERLKADAGLRQGARALRALAEYFGKYGEQKVLRTARVREEALRPKARAAVREALQAALEADLEKMWPALDPRQALAALLADGDLLAQHGRGLLSADEIELLQQDPPPDDAPLDLSELPALLYLQLISQGLPAALYDHVVVDEAQDAAPLYYAALRRFSRNASLTILGDLAQGVYSYRGVAGWDDVRQAFAGLPFTFGDMRESYRSTTEIISFANRLLELLTPPGQAAAPAIPFERHGPPVLLRRLERESELAPELARAITALQTDGYRNIAVIAKSADECARLAETLEAAGVAGAQFASATEMAYSGGVLVLPVHLAKGLEFEAVLLAGASEANYPSLEFEGRLLYVAVTRALHALQIFAVGAPNALLELAAEPVSAAAPG